MMHYAASHTFLSHDCGGRTLDQVLFFSYLNVLQHFHHSPGTYSRDHSYNPLHAGNKHHKKKKSLRLSVRLITCSTWFLILVNLHLFKSICGLSVSGVVSVCDRPFSASAPSVCFQSSSATKIWL